MNFDVSMTGFRDARLDVRWSLFSASGHPLPRDWLRNLPILWLSGEEDTDSASGEFWVPIPQRPGQYYIRVGVYDEDGTRLTYKNTRRFR